MPAMLQPGERLVTGTITATTSTGDSLSSSYTLFKEYPPRLKMYSIISLISSSIPLAITNKSDGNPRPDLLGISRPRTTTTTTKNLQQVRRNGGGNGDDGY